MEWTLLLVLVVSVWTSAVILGMSLATVNEQMGCVLRALRNLQHAEVVMAGALDSLTAEVARNTDVDASAKLLLVRLAAKIQELIDAGANPAALQALVDSLKASTDDLSAAVAANTPAEP